MFRFSLNIYILLSMFVLLFNHNLSFQGLSIRETKGMFLKLAGLRNNNYLQNCYLRWYLISKET